MNGAKAPETPSPTLQEKTVTPETLPTVIGADEGYDGLSQVTVNPDAQLKAENIRSGKTVFGVEGSFVGEPQPVDQLPKDFIVGTWSLDNNKIAAIRNLGNSSNTQYYTKMGSYTFDKVGYQYRINSNGGVATNFRAWSSGDISLYYNDSVYPSQFICDKVTIAEPIIIEPGEYSIRCPINLFNSVNFTGTIAVFPVLQGYGGALMTVPTNDYEIIENVTGKTNGLFTVTTTKTFTIPANDYLIDKGWMFESTKVGLSFVPVEINQVTS